MQEMENRRRSVNSPQRILSFSRNRKAKVFFQDDQPPHQRPKTSEVYGFVGSITTVVALDEYSTNPVSLVLSTEEDEPPIPPMFDISINQPNQ